MTSDPEARPRCARIGTRGLRTGVTTSPQPHPARRRSHRSASRAAPTTRRQGMMMHGGLRPTAADVPRLRPGPRLRASSL
jgi:hypothetical protein